MVVSSTRAGSNAVLLGDESVISLAVEGRCTGAS